MLYILPNALSQEEKPPQEAASIVSQLDGLICESEKNGRAYLKHFSLKMALQVFPLALLNEHTKPEELKKLLEPIQAGQKWGIISDAGLACIADPGSDLVRMAHSMGIVVKTFYGPSSITMALQLSGCIGQRFSFHGYLPREKEARIAELKKLEQQAKKEKATQIFIEAPYRNMELLQDAIATLQPSCYLVVAWDLGTSSQGLICQTVAKWKAKPLPEIHKKPAIFLFNT